LYSDATRQAPGHGGPGGWWILYGPEPHLGTDVLAPISRRGVGSECPPEVFKLRAGRWVLIATHAEGGGVRAEPFAAVELELDALWITPAG